MANFAEPPPHVLRVPKWVLAIHAVQVLFAVIILGLSAYGVHWIAYNALIFAIVVCICTFGVCAYLLASQLFLHKLYNMYIALILHLWMLLFWVIDLGLVANLARLWSGDGYYYTFSWYYTDYYGYKKRDIAHLAKREDTTTVAAYYGALAAGSVFAAVEFVSWIAVTVILIIALSKHRSNNANTTTHVLQPPPQYAADQAVPMEKFGQTSTQPQPQATPQQQYAQPVQPQQYQQQPQQYVQQPPQQGGPYMQQQQQQQQQPQGQFGAPYPQDPVPRQDTVSPVSSAAYGYAPPSNVSELNSPQHTGAAYPSNASELGNSQIGGGPRYNDPNVPELSDRK